VTFSRKPVLMPTSRRVRFGSFELDLSTGELGSISGPDPKNPEPDNPEPNNPEPNNKVILREQVFQVLRMLLERQGKIVTREEIQRRLWPGDTVVDFDHSINATIRTLRRALGIPRTILAISRPWRVAAID